MSEEIPMLKNVGFWAKQMSFQNGTKEWFIIALLILSLYQFKFPLLWGNLFFLTNINWSFTLIIKLINLSKLRYDIIFKVGVLRQLLVKTTEQAFLWHWQHMFPSPTSVVIYPLPWWSYLFIISRSIHLDLG